MRIAALGRGPALLVFLLAGLLAGCGGGTSSGDGSGGTGQGGGEQSSCLQRHPLLNSRQLATREEAVSAFYQAKADCGSTLPELVEQAKLMEQNGNHLN